MKNLTILIATTLLLMSFFPIQLRATTLTRPVSTDLPKPSASAEVNVLLFRLGEIKGIDRSNMSSLERKTLRKETRSIKNQLREVRGGVYLSVGAIIIIVLVLVLLL